MRTTSVLALTAALLALAAAPATADSWDGRDARRDVRGYDITIASACEKVTQKAVLPHDRRRDITGLGVDHGADSVVVVLALRDVARHDKETSYMLALRTPERTYDVQVYPGRRGQAEAAVEVVRPVLDPDHPECGRILEAHELAVPRPGCRHGPDCAHGHGRSPPILPRRPSLGAHRSPVRCRRLRHPSDRGPGRERHQRHVGSSRRGAHHGPAAVRSPGANQLAQLAEQPLHTVVRRPVGRSDQPGRRRVLSAVWPAAEGAEVGT